MAIAFVISAKKQSVSTASTTGVDTSGANCIVLSVAYYFGLDSSFTSVSDNKSNTYTQRSIAGAGVQVGHRLYVCENATVGTGHTFTVTTSGGGIFFTLVAAAFSGVATASAFDTQSSGFDASITTSTTGSVTPGQANSLLVAGYSSPDGSTGTSSTPTNFTLVDKAAYSAGVAEGGGSFYEIQTTATARNPSFTGWSGGAGTNLPACIVVLKPAAGGTSVALTGVSATGAIGNLGKSLVRTITGVLGTGSLGTLAPKQTKALTGVQGSGSVGTLGVQHKNALTGVSGTGQLGTLTPVSGFFKALTGVQGTGSVGTLGVQHKNPLTGIQGTGQLGTLTPTTSGGTVSVALTGIQARGLLGTLSPTGGVIIDTHDGGEKRRKAHEKQKKKEEREDRDRQDKRRRQMIAAFEQVIEGKVSRETIEETNIEQVIAPAATYAVNQPEITAKSDFAFDKWLENLANAERILDDYLEADDEEVLVLL